MQGDLWQSFLTALGYLYSASPNLMTELVSASKVRSCLLHLKDARSTDVEQVYYGCGSRGPSISWRFPLNRSPADSLTGDLFAVGGVGRVLQRVLERAGPLLGLCWASPDTSFPTPRFPPVAASCYFSCLTCSY